MAEANLNYQTIRTTHAAREADDQRNENRKKNLIVLILQWLADEGYIESARQLEHETNLDVSKYDVCDNVDLNTILQEYESYFFVKFNRYPKLTKKQGPSTSAFMSKISAKMSAAQPSNRRTNLPSLPRVMNNGIDMSSNNNSIRLQSAGDNLRRTSSTGKFNQTSTTSTTPSSTQRQNSNPQSTNSLEEMSLSFMKVSSVKSAPASNEQQTNGNKKKSLNTVVDCRAMLNDALRAHAPDNLDPSDRLLKPLGGFTGYTSEWRELAEVISRVNRKEERQSEFSFYKKKQTNKLVL